ncbi:hypothetical protein HYPSUDRAFT_456805 [Hypholoma sublateritium FD-334 SS-4]|uniref:Uncharacterized protein n=1 Tax=Hypholoma sublateritium (strain FD-334 SS-4) TaxID=945553 RepID=A0A0D2P1X5_HYPSF|nr:hypothetical protein HYPSUDRAFT_456805 [Hypholoma sublateritium FD-334 SS-4]
MAAVYLHNEIFAGSPSQPRDIQEHSRNISTISSATLVTNTTLHSQPHEPLLQQTALHVTAQTETYNPYPPHNLAGPSTHLRWGDTPVVQSEPKSLNEKSRWDVIRRESTRWSKIVTVILDILIAAWSIYNTIRYFIAFTVYDRTNTPRGQSLSFALGTCTGIALGLILCSKTLFLVKHRLLHCAQSFRYLTRTCCVLRYLSSLFILTPAIVNFVFLFVWRNSSNSHYNVHDRCHSFDIDIVWSASRGTCSGKSSPWGVWLAISCIRLVLTLAVPAVYHVVSLTHLDHPRRPLHHRLRSESYPSAPITSRNGSSSTAVTLSENSDPNHDLSTRHQTSDTTLGDSYRPPSRLSRARSHSSGVSDTTTPTKSIRSGYRSSPPDVDDEQNAHFQSLFNQISQETDDALNFAASDHAPSPETTREHGPSPTPSHPPGLQNSYHNAHYASDDDDDDYDVCNDASRFHGNNSNIYNLPPVAPVLGYNEFGMPYPPDQDMRMLNGFIRRMPTIESMGSGEITMSITGSTRLGGSMHTSSRPPTRNTLLSFTSSMDYDIGSSAPPSRPNSFSARAVAAGLSPNNSNSNSNGSSEHGELLGRPEFAMQRVSSPTSYLEFPDGGPRGAALDTHSSSGSRGTTMSYHTATMGSSSDSHPISLRSPGISQ